MMSAHFFKEGLQGKGQGRMIARQGLRDRMDLLKGKHTKGKKKGRGL